MSPSSACQKNSEKAAHYVPKYLASNGYNIMPVNPTTSEILEKKCYSSINEINEPIDIVDVFRPSEQVLPVVEEAIKMKPKVIWLQEINSDMKALTILRQLSHGKKSMTELCHLLNLSYTLAEEFKVIYRHIE